MDKFNAYRYRKLDDKYFLTTDSGSFIILSEKEFSLLQQNELGKLDEKLKKKLKEKFIIISEDNQDDYISDLRQRLSYISSSASLHIIVLTLRCTMNCAYCHASSRKETEIQYDMDSITAKKTVDFIFTSPSKEIHIEFQGGEPLLNWGALQFIVDYTEEKNKIAGKDLKFSIVTNLTDMDEEKMNFLIENNVGVCTSLDGPRYLHDFNRKYTRSSNYDLVSKWIRIFNSEYKKRKIDNRINALLTVTKKSLSCPEEIIDEYISLGLPMIHVRFLNNLGVAKSAWESISYDEKEYLDFWQKSLEYIGSIKKHGKVIEERMVSIIHDKINNKTDPNYVDLRSPCGAVIGQLVYNYNGDIYSCDEARMLEDDMFLLGNVREGTYSALLGTKKACALINSSINDQYICDSCAYKPYCGVCPVCSYAEEGNLFSYKHFMKRCNIFKSQFDWVVKNKFIKSGAGFSYDGVSTSIKEED